MNWLKEAEKIANEFRYTHIKTEHFILAFLRKDEDFVNATNLDIMEFEEEVLYFSDTRKEKGQEYVPLISAPVAHLLEKLKEDFTPTDFMLELFKINDKSSSRILYDVGFDKEFYLNIVDKDRIPDILLNNDFLVNLNQKVEQQGIKIFGMDKKEDELINNLFKVRKPNILIIGKAGCGKSALVEGLAERINKQDVPEFMKDKVIFEMVVPNAVAGTKYRGEFEERIKDILKAVQKCPRVILFIDEFHTVMTAGGAEGAVALANILKPYLARGTISLIGATTTEEYSAIKKDKAMQRRFTTIYMTPPSVAEVELILKGWVPKLEAHYGVEINNEVIRDIIRQCRKDKSNSSPDKELDALEAWCLENCNWRALNWKAVTNK